MPLTSENGFDLWYEANMSFQPFASEAHRAGARAAWIALGSRVLDVAASLQPEPYSNESYDVAYAKADISLRLIEAVA